MSTFHCWGNFILKPRFYSTNNALSAMCNVNVCKTWSNRSCGVQIPWDICTRFGCYLYPTETIRFNIHLKYFPVSDCLTSPGQFFITSWCWPNLEDASNIPSIRWYNAQAASRQGKYPIDQPRVSRHGTLTGFSRVS